MRVRLRQPDREGERALQEEEMRFPEVQQGIVESGWLCAFWNREGGL